MNTVLRWIAAIIVIYFGVNWIADNPKTMTKIKTKMNESVREGSKWVKDNASKAIDDASKSAKEST